MKENLKENQQQQSHPKKRNSKIQQEESDDERNFEYICLFPHCQNPLQIGHYCDHQEQYVLQLQNFLSKINKAFKLSNEEVLEVLEIQNQELRLYYEMIENIEDENTLRKYLYTDNNAKNADFFDIIRRLEFCKEAGDFKKNYRQIIQENADQQIQQMNELEEQSGSLKQNSQISSENEYSVQDIKQDQIKNKKKKGYSNQQNHIQDRNSLEQKFKKKSSSKDNDLNFSDEDEDEEDEDSQNRRYHTAKKKSKKLPVSKSISKDKYTFQYQNRHKNPKHQQKKQAQNKLSHSKQREYSNYDIRGWKPQYSSQELNSQLSEEQNLQSREVTKSQSSNQELNSQLSEEQNLQSREETQDFQQQFLQLMQFQNKFKQFEVGINLKLNEQINNQNQLQQQLQQQQQMLQQLLWQQQQLQQQQLQQEEDVEEEEKQGGN